MLTRILRAVALFFALVAAAAAFAQEVDVKPTIDAVRATLAEIDAALKEPVLTDAELLRLRSENDPLAAQLQSVIAELTPRLEASQKRLTELTPKSKDTALSDEAAAELAAEKQKYDAIDANLRTARALLLQVDEDSARIGAARRDLFARQTLARSSSVLSPELWWGAIREAPNAVSSAGSLFAEFLERLTPRQALAFVAVVAALIAIGLPLSWVAGRVIVRGPTKEPPTRLRRGFAAIWTAMVLALLPLIALWALNSALDLFDISDPRLEGAFDSTLVGLRIIVVANALGRAIFSPGREEWRLVNVDDRYASALARLWLWLAAVVAAQRVVEPLADAVASLNIAILARGVGATIVGALIILTMRRFPFDLERAGPRESPPPLRAAVWAIAVVIIGAAVTGYIAFAAFLVNQLLFVSALWSVLYLFDLAVREGGEALMRPDAQTAKSVQAIVGVPVGALTQAIVLLQGAVRLAVILVGVVLTLAPWGVQSQDMFGSLRTAYFGFNVGGVTISPSSIVAAIGVFVVVILAWRAAQTWLGARFLPQTRLDSGLRNSILTAFGYVGVVVALLLSGAQLGIDLQKFAIIFGALSVGIGFGLQSIVNNFVSGLILLWERGIRVGDWVVVGPEQGFVRRIHARATEIETFDRATLIVPNATLVSGAVKNWMYADRVARIVVSVNVAYESDPEAVRELLIAAAKGQDMVLSIPAPLVLFTDFADWSLKFQLICFVDDIMVAERVRSELNFDVFKRMREAGFRIPYPK